MYLPSSPLLLPLCDVTVLVAGASVDDMTGRDVTVLVVASSGRHASARPLGRAVNASDVIDVMVCVPFRGSEKTRLK